MVWGRCLFFSKPQVAWFRGQLADIEETFSFPTCKGLWGTTQTKGRRRATALV